MFAGRYQLKFTVFVGEVFSTEIGKRQLGIFANTGPFGDGLALADLRHLANFETVTGVVERGQLVLCCAEFSRRTRPVRGYRDISLHMNAVNSGHGQVRILKIITGIITTIFTIYGVGILGPSFVGTGVNDEW